MISGASGTRTAPPTRCTVSTVLGAICLPIEFAMRSTPGRKMDDETGLAGALAPLRLFDRDAKRPGDD